MGRSGVFAAKSGAGKSAFRLRDEPGRETSAAVARPDFGKAYSGGGRLDRLVGQRRFCPA